MEEIRIVSSREGGDGGGAEALRLLGSVAAEAGGVLCGSGETVQVVKLNPQQCATLINANSTTPNAVTDSAGENLRDSLTSFMQSQGENVENRVSRALFPETRGNVSEKNCQVEISTPCVCHLFQVSIWFPV